MKRILSFSQRAFSNINTLFLPFQTYSGTSILSQHELGILEKNESGDIALKFSEQKIKELEFCGIMSVCIEGPKREQTYTSFNFQTLFIQELNLLDLQIKAYIVFLKSVERPEEELRKSSHLILTWIDYGDF